ncbi:hypothetical protein [Flavobacterium sp. 140616W15]|uniref:hypothetical protein n=1 Tax=Flavobacterium sp. 140616W15 TaxID=2478552 RepID=UPI000F0C0942|nr:hypothetical protein [Flavobacterium sp. 140616W15]AYN05149.1 hypothetical protein EAG11_14070 [Flavobacterium sp. 140616W15]
MSTKIGIYVTGLGQSIDNETVEKYAERLINELSFKTSNISYSLKIEKKFYQTDKECTVVSLFQKNKNTLNKNQKKSPFYKIYDFQYHRILTDRFNHYNIIVKNLVLFGLVLKKLPQIFLRLFNGNGFSRPLQTFYAISILFTISICILFLIPGCIELLTTDDPKNQTLIEKINIFLCSESIPTIPVKLINSLGKKVLAITTLILLFIPKSKTIITSLATEFSCVDSYITNGEQSQILLGNLDLLIEYIAEKEVNPEIHFHAYSFGSILAIDTLFPIAKIPPSDNIQKLTKLLITIGNPFEFINAYYPTFYNDRCDIMKDRIKWLNIYSIADVFSTNHRRDNTRGEAEFGIKDISLTPENINYEITSDKSGLVAFFSLNSIKMHRCYWDKCTIGQSCMKVLLPKLIDNKYL